MNARVPIRIVSPSCQTACVSPWGFRIECDFDFDEGEPAIWSPIDRAHPGTPPNAELIACRVNAVDITEMLDGTQRERIEEKLIEQMEGL